MQELEKILEEIEMKKKKCLDIVRVEIDPMEITIHREQYKGLRMAEDIIRKHMNDGWIPVEERLPTKEERKKDNNNFLVQVDSGERFSCEYDPEANGYDNPQWCCNIPVVAWRPLPEPYHPERSDKNDGE